MWIFRRISSVVQVCGGQTICGELMLAAEEVGELWIYSTAISASP